MTCKTSDSVFHRQVKMINTVKVIQKPSEVYNTFYRIGCFLATLLGVNTLNSGYRMNRITWCVISCIFFYWLFTMTTMWSLYKKKEILKMVEAACLMASVVQGPTKMYTAISKKEKFHATCQLLRDLYTENESKGPKYKAAAYRCLAAFKKTIITVTLCYIVSLIGFCLMPLVLLLFTGNYYLMMPFTVPGFDIATTNGYWMTTVIHEFLGILGLIGLFIGDYIIILYIMHSVLFQEIFKVKVEILNELLEDDNPENATTEELLVDMLKWHQIFIEYMTQVNDIAFPIVSVQVMTSGLSIGLSCFIILINGWPGSYAYLLLSMINLYCYCIIGTKVEYNNDEFCHEIYNIKWYFMKAQQQKMVRLMLMQSQSPNVIKVAGYMPLSVSTALQITKVIFSSTMFLKHCLETEQQRSN